MEFWGSKTITQNTQKLSFLKIDKKKIIKKSPKERDSIQYTQASKDQR
jgi:hypothetical protein